LEPTYLFLYKALTINLNTEISMKLLEICGTEPTVIDENVDGDVFLDDDVGKFSNGLERHQVELEALVAADGRFGWSTFRQRRLQL
jgi:hypothetical protein